MINELIQSGRHPRITEAVLGLIYLGRGPFEGVVAVSAGPVQTSRSSMNSVTMLEMVWNWRTTSSSSAGV